MNLSKNLSENLKFRTEYVLCFLVPSTNIHFLGNRNCFLKPVERRRNGRNFSFEKLVLGGSVTEFSSGTIYECSESVAPVSVLICPYCRPAFLLNG